jgi:tryptophan-rich sensory protein
MVRAIVTAALAATAVAVAGALVTELGPWYFGLRKPAWQPPDWLFGPAWTLIFGLAAVAGVLGWNAAADRRERVRLLLLFAINAALNVGWSLLFFRLHRPDWALAEVVLLWLSIVVLMVVLWRSSRLAALALVPYLAWVTFAGILNRAIVVLNAPFH